MNEQSYPLLDNAPEHDSPDFISYLRRNNVVIHEDERWIVIENCKYHTFEKPWYTAFHKEGTVNLFPLIKKFGHMEWRKKSVKKQTVKRFHIHIF